MTDVVNKETRSRMMSGIRGKDTRPELLIRHGLHRKGFRFKVHDKGVLGCPDLVLKKYLAVIFIHGCFWHKHDCRLFKWPGTRKKFWREKITGNHARDQEIVLSLADMGWRICIVWECAIKGSTQDRVTVLNSISGWLKGNKKMLEISG